MSDIKDSSVVNSLPLVGLDLRGLDPGFKEHAFRGIGRYIRNLHSALAECNGRNLKICNLHVNSFPYNNLADSICKIFPFGRQTVRNQLFYPLQLRAMGKSGLKLIHFPAQMDAPAWSRTPYLLTILDLIPFIFEDLYRGQAGGWRYDLARALEIRGIKGANSIVAISQNTANDIMRIFNYPAERIHVVPLGIEESFFIRWQEVSDQQREEVLNHFSIPSGRRLLIYVGGIDQRKNIGVMLESIALLRELYLDQPVMLLIAGKIDKDKQYTYFKDLVKKFNLREQIKELGFVEDHLLLQLLAISDLFFFPSLYEGFGFPPLEAQAVGLPVISSNTSSMPEFLGEGAILCPPENALGFAKEISSLLQNRELAKELSCKGRKQAKKLPWSKTAELTLDVYQQILREMEHIG